VFAGSSPGNDPAFAEAARALGAELVSRGYGLVYGGAKVGLMGMVADTVIAAGGHVFGVMPDFLATKALLAFLNHAVSRQLLRAENFDMVISASSPGALLDRMQAYTAPQTAKWISTERT
jgi:predicted Rossmann-fold nucleotide-binding protein